MESLRWYIGKECEVCVDGYFRPMGTNRTTQKRIGFPGLGLLVVVIVIVVVVIVVVVCNGDIGHHASKCSR